MVVNLFLIGPKVHVKVFFQQCVVGVTITVTIVSYFITVALVSYFITVTLVSHFITVTLVSHLITVTLLVSYFIIVISVTSHHGHTTKCEECFILTNQFVMVVFKYLIITVRD